MRTSVDRLNRLRELHDRLAVIRERVRKVIETRKIADQLDTIKQRRRY